MFSYPVAYFHRQCFWRGELPLWNPFNNCGLPFLAQWNTLTLYPLSLIYLLLPLTWSLSFFCLAHLFWGGLGMYFLAHRWTHHRLAAGLAGVIFCVQRLVAELSDVAEPRGDVQLAAVGGVAGATGLARGREGAGVGDGGGRDADAGGRAGDDCGDLADPVGAGVGGDWVRGMDSRRAEDGRHACAVWRFRGDGGTGGAGLRGAIAAVPGTAGPFPARQRLQRLHPRLVHAALGLGQLPGAAVPDLAHSAGLFLQNGQYWTSSYYAGIGTVLLAAVAVWRVRDWRVRAMAVLVLLGLVLALGDGTLLYRGLRVCFPGLGFVRYPVKFVILVLALAPLLAAFGFAALAGKTRPAGRFELIGALLMLLLVGAIVALDWKSSPPADAWRATWQSGLSRAGVSGSGYSVRSRAALVGWPPADSVRLPAAGALLARFCDPRADAKPGRETIRLCAGLGPRATEVEPGPETRRRRASCSRPPRWSF